MNLHLKNQLDTKLQSWVGCTRCPLHVTRTQTVFGSGNDEDPVIFMIGQAPGEREDKEGKPFIGPVSWHLDRAMEKAKIDRESDCYITNSVICRPWIPHLKRNITPSISSLEKCRERLLIEYEKVRHSVKVIILIGKEAHMAWLRHEDFSDPSFNPSQIRMKDVIGWNGIFSDLDHMSDDKRVYTIYHPSYIARQGSAKLAQDWLNDWVAISKFVFNGEVESPREA